MRLESVVARLARVPVTVETLQERREDTALALDFEKARRCRDMTLSLLASRSPDATLCPSEIARAIAPGDFWREAMPAVHAAVDRLFEEGSVRLSWKGRPLTSRAGPYRISRAAGR